MKKQISVLIADDNDVMQKSLSLLISMTEGLQLAGVARNGEEAIAMATGLSPDIILMDINMSPVNGFEATRKILKNKPAVRIIGLSLHTEPTYAKNMLKLGVKGYVTKASDHQEIIKAIMKVAAGGKYIDKELEDKI